jgi:hypothetical protein
MTETEIRERDNQTVGTLTRPAPPPQPLTRPSPLSRPAQPAAPPSPRRQSEQPRQAKQTSQRRQQMPFFLLLCALLGGALVCALVITTTLAEGSYRITKLQQSNDMLARQRQILQEQVAAAQSSPVIEQRALRLGMRPAGELRFLDLKTGKVETDAADAGDGAAADISVPGYTP